jgi:hypothetical protein
MPRRIGWVAGALVVQIIVAAAVGIWKIASVRMLGESGLFESPFFHAMATADWAIAVPAAIVLTAAALASHWWPDAADRLADFVAGHVKIIALATVSVLLVATHVVYLRYPLSMDEYAATFQAEVFAAGELAGRWPPWAAPLMVSPRFANRMFLLCNYDTGRVVSTYWPVHAALLAPFSRIGIDWALNPLLAGAAILLVASLAQHLAGSRGAGYAVLFTVASPVFHAYGMSYYSMMCHLVANLAYARLLISPSPARAAAAGGIGGLALALHNPFPHAIFGGAWIAWLLATRRWACGIIVAACSLAVFLPIDSGWRVVKDSVQADEPPPVTTGGDPGRAEESSVSNVAARVIGYAEALRVPNLAVMASRRIYAFVREVSWDTPALVVMAAAGAVAGGRCASPLALAALATFFGYAFSPWDGGHGQGSRYMVSAWGMLPVLAGVAAATKSASGGRLMNVGGLAAMGSLVVCVPLGMWLVRSQIAETLASGPHELIAQHEADADRLWVFLGESESVTQDFIRNDPFARHGPYILFGQSAEQNAANIRLIASQLGAVPQNAGGDDRGTAWILVRPAP